MLVGVIFGVAPAIRAENDEDLRRLEEKLDFKFQDVLTKLDSVYKEPRDMRLEQDMHVQKHRDIDDRFEKIESAVRN